MSSWSLHIGNLVDAAGGLLLAGLGIWVLMLRPRTRATIGLGLFAGGFGLGTALSNLSFATGPPTRLLVALSLTSTPVVVAAAIGLLLIGVSFPQRLTYNDRRFVPRALAGGLFVIAPGLYAISKLGAPRDLAALGINEALFIPLSLGWGAALVVVGVSWAVIFLLVLRLRTIEPPERRPAVLMTAALLFYPGVTSAHYLVQPHGAYRALAGTSIFAMAVLALSWARAARTTDVSRTARNVVLFVVAWLLAGMMYAYWAGGAIGSFGVARTLTVLVLAYAILRHRLLGIDVKVRWTISKTTLAALFVTVFFVVSEVGQLIFEGLLGGPVLGIMAAGALVFAFAPLSRLADRLAAKAVPLSELGDLARQPERRQEVYRTAIRHALRDRTLTRPEERYLADLATELGLDASTALSLREEVELSIDTPDSA